MDAVRTRTVIATLLVAALAGCGACDQPPSDALEDCTTSSVFAGRVKTDILFVIDDSVSMAGEQQQMKFALGRFIDRLASSPIANDYQIGVTNTSVDEYLLVGGGQPSDFQAYGGGPSAGVPYPDGTLVAVDPTNVVSGTASTYGDFIYATGGADPGYGGPRILTWNSPTLVTDFQNNVLMGTNGASREQPFRAARLALTDRLADKNANFLRPGARLAIIFLTDEDDCSGPPDPGINGDGECAGASSLVQVSDFAAFLEGPIGGEVRDVVVAAITGVTCTAGGCSAAPKCTSAFSSPHRIVALLSALPPERTRLASICDPTFDSALDEFADAIMGQTLPLDGAVADYRMLVATVTKPGVGDVGCTIASESDPAAVRNAADAVYKAPQAGRPASLTFQGDCALQPGDAVSVDVVCIR